MKLRLNKSQEPTMFGGKTKFSLTAKVDLTDLEREYLDKYKLGKEVLYCKENVTPDHVNYSSWGGIARNLTAAALNMRITANELVYGRTVECKDIVEMMDVEATMKQACEGLKILLEACGGFKGEEIVDY